jgi:hypothetical protein
MKSVEYYDLLRRGEIVSSEKWAEHKLSKRAIVRIGEVFREIVAGVDLNDLNHQIANWAEDLLKKEAKL